MGTTLGKQTVEIGYATAKDIQQHYRGWAKSVDVANTPLGRIGPALAEAWTRDQLSSTLVPDLPDALSTMIAANGPEAKIYSRSLVLSARVEGRLIGGLVARPQLRFVDGVAPFGVTVRMQTLVRLEPAGICTNSAIPA